MENKQVQHHTALVAIVMGSDSDWPVMKHAAQMLADFGVSYEAKVVSAHRTPDLMFRFAESAASNGYQVIIAGAGGAAHLPGMVAAKTTLPVLGVPVPSKHLQGQDSLLSIVQMPRGIPVATFAIGDAGAANAGLFAVSMLANQDANLAKKLIEFRAKQSDKVHAMELSDKP
ncbi:MAG TPA: 5-(carboxyamino)imidazole ribonucleotide mutase [Methylophilaceae bacterium]|nr:5-(carboxyamino)imidazole ribonucleotide mutase [Methylophilaceae bacterium]